MKIIEIAVLDNGAHTNRERNHFDAVPEGWAVIPDTMTIPATFPFVNITVKDGVVTSMTANQEAYDAAKAAEEREPEEALVTPETMAAAIRKGVNAV